MRFSARFVTSNRFFVLTKRQNDPRVVTRHNIILFHAACTLREWVRYTLSRVDDETFFLSLLFCLPLKTIILILRSPYLVSNARVSLDPSQYYISIYTYKYIYIKYRFPGEIVSDNSNDQRSKFRYPLGNSGTYRISLNHNFTIKIPSYRPDTFYLSFCHSSFLILSSPLYLCHIFSFLVQSCPVRFSKYFNSFFFGLVL